MSDQDPFAKNKQMIMDGTAKATEAVKKVISRKQSEREKYEEYKRELKADALECQSLFKDARFSRSQKFMSDMRKNLSKALETMSPQYPHEIAKLQGKIELFDELLERPERIVKEWERIEKESNEK
jgi:hypothetical protein